MDKYLDLSRKLKISLKHERDGDTNTNAGARINPRRFGERDYKI